MRYIIFRSTLTFTSCRPIESEALQHVKLNIVNFQHAYDAQISRELR